MGLDLETFDPDPDNRVDLSEFIHIDRLEPEPGKEGAGWRERMVLRAPQVRAFSTSQCGVKILHYN